MLRYLRSTLIVLAIVTCFAEVSLATSSVMLTISGKEQYSSADNVWDTGTISVIINGRAETVTYGRHSTVESIASALAAKLSMDCRAVVRAKAAASVVVLVARNLDADLSSISASRTFDSSHFQGGSFRVDNTGPELESASIISVSEDRLDFASQAVQTSSSLRTITLSNLGGSPLVLISLGIYGKHEADFSQINDCGAALLPGRSCEVTASFTPSAIGPREALLTINSNDPASGIVFVPLTGNGARTLIISAQNASRAYGAQNPTLKGSVTGLQAGDNVSVSFVSEANQSSPVGTYRIVPHFLDPGNVLGNYIVQINAGTLLITPVSLSVTANSFVRLHGNQNPTFTGTIAGLRNSDNITASYSTIADAASPVGTYVIVPSVVDPSGRAGNYNVTLTNGSLIIRSAPVAVAATPSAGSARNAVISFEYADAAGFASITSTQSLINATNTFTKACGLRYIAASHSAQITTDDGVSWGALLPLGQGGTLSNSQCSVNMALSSASGSGNNLTVSYAIAFDPNFVGAKNIYGLATNKFGNSSQLQQKGTWTLAALSPSIVSLTPNAGSERTQLFQFVYSDPAGYAAITSTQHLFNASNTFTSACGVRYVAASNALQLTSDSGATWSPLATLGSQTTLSNSQCSIDVANSSVVGSSTSLVVTVMISFKPNFIGMKNIYTLASNKFGLSTGLQQKGTWVLPTH